MIPYGRHFVDEEDIAAVVEVLRGELLTQGPKAAEFERLVADYVGARFAVSVANGTAALHLACLALEIGEGDALVTSPNTFIASSNCALYVGATPIFCDIEAETLNLDPAVLERTLRSRQDVRVVVAVHFAGVPCDMPRIAALCREGGVRVVEDACHALGGTYADGSRVGNCRYSDMTTFSFHPVKAIAAGEGGMITTNDETLYRRLLHLRNHGMTKVPAEFTDLERGFDRGEPNPWYYEMQSLGLNYRMTDMQCALAISQFKKLDRFIARRREIARQDDHAFSGWSKLRPIQEAYRERSGHHLYVTRIDFEKVGLNRGELMLALRARGVGSQVHYIPVPYQPFYRAQGLSEGAWPKAEAYYREALSIPLYFGMSDDDVQTVVQALSELLGDSQTHGRTAEGSR